VDINWNSAAVINYFNPTIGHQGYVDFSAIPSKGFIYRVIHDFINQVMKAAFAGRADIHTWALSDRL
jgi:hypothetical protein